MMNPDLINGLFEVIGAAFAWKNAATLYRHKEVRGTYWPTTAFFSAWGLWNLYYYPALEQVFSFWGGVFLVAANMAWVLLALIYRRRAVIGSAI